MSKLYYDLTEQDGSVIYSGWDKEKFLSHFKSWLDYQERIFEKNTPPKKLIFGIIDVPQDGDGEE